METLNAIIQISILLIVAYLIGIVTEWLYWRHKYRKMKRHLEDEIREKNRLLAAGEKTLADLNTQNRGLNNELNRMKKKEAQSTGDAVPEELYSAIVKDMGEGVSVSNDDGYFLVFNPKLEEITGYTREEANGQREKLFLDKLYPDENLRKEVTRHISDIPEDDTYTNIKTTLTTKDGRKVPVLVSSTILEYNKRKFYLTAYRDVSEKPVVEA